MPQSFVFAIVTAIVFGLWTVFHEKAAGYINSLFGAILVSFTAVILGLILLLPKIGNTTLYTHPKGLIFAALAGIAALGIDFFALKAYSSGGQVSVVGPIIIAGSIAVASVIGFFLGESVSVLKVLGISLIVIGAAILASITK